MQHLAGWLILNGVTALFVLCVIRAVRRTIRRWRAERDNATE